MSDDGLVERLRALLAKLRTEADEHDVEARKLSQEGHSVWSQDESSRAAGLREACTAVEALLPTRAPPRHTLPPAPQTREQLALDVWHGRKP